MTNNDYPTPPDWPVTDRPLRIAVLGWARLMHQAREGSGYNLSASELASGLALSGHHVVSLSSGLRYSLRPGVHIRRAKTWRRIECFELYNSPVLAPSITNFRNIKPEAHCPPVTRAVLAWLDEHRVDIVHIHSLEGYALDLIGAIRNTGRHVVVTLHNYWFLCPQVDLFYKDSRVCNDYDGGRRCVDCVDAPSPFRERSKRRFLQAIAWLGGPKAANIAKAGAKVALERVTRSDRENTRPLPPPDPELARGFDVAADAHHPGTIEHNLQPAPAEEIPSPGRMAYDENEQFLRADHHLKVLNDYGRRRINAVESLSRASLVTPPSDFLRKAHVAMHLDESRTRTVRLGQPHFDQLHRRAKRSFYYDRVPWTPDSDGPLRIGFFGTTRANKGFEVFVRAIHRLQPSVRRRCQFQIHVSGWDWPYRRRLARFPEVSYMGPYDIIQLIGAGGEYHVGVLGHVWLENSPLVLLEHLHAAKFVITPRLGGPPEWIVEPGTNPDYPLGNGLLFPGGDDESLARAITRIVTGEVRIPAPIDVHRVTPNLQSYPGHVREFESIYHQLIDSGS